MSITEKFRKAEKEEAIAQDKKEGVKRFESPEFPTLKKILADTEQSQLFVLYLNEQGAIDLATRLASGELTPQDLSQLNDHREGFLIIKESVNEISKRFRGKNIKEIIDFSPELKEIANLVDTEGIQRALLKNFQRTAINNPEQFADIVSAVENITATEMEMKEEDKRVAEICKTYGINEEDYLKALRDKDQDAVNELIEGKIGIFRKIFSSKESINREISGADRFDDIKELNEKYDQDLKSIADALRATLFTEGEAYMSLLGELRGQRYEAPEKELSFSEFVKIPMDEEKVKSAWQTYREDHADDEGYSEIQAMQDFSNEYIEGNVTKKKKGWWSKISKNLWTSFIKDVLK